MGQDMIRYAALGYRKKWKLTKNQNIKDIFNNNVETIIFSDAYSFLSTHADSTDYVEKKSDVFFELFKNLQKLKNIVFYFNESEDEELDSKKNYFLTLLLYKLINNNKNINIHLLNIDIDKILNDKSSNDGVLGKKDSGKNNGSQRTYAFILFFERDI